MIEMFGDRSPTLYIYMPLWRLLGGLAGMGLHACSLAGCGMVDG